MYYKVQLYKINNTNKMSTIMDRISSDIVERMGQVIVKKNRLFGNVKEIITNCNIKVIESTDDYKTNKKFEYVILSNDLKPSNLASMNEVSDYYNRGNNDFFDDDNRKKVM